MTLGSNKLKEKTIYDEKQRVAITEQRQYDLLSNVVSKSWSFGLLKSRYNVSRQMKSNTDKHSVSSRGFIPAPFQYDCRCFVLSTLLEFLLHTYIYKIK